MELNLRTVLVVLGAIVMLGILVDGFRRMRRARHEALTLDVKGDFQFPESNFSSELPNGGARVIAEREAEDLMEDAKNFRNQLDSLPVMSALDEIEEQAVHDLDTDIQESLREDRIYAGEPDFQHDSYAHTESTAVIEKVQADVETLAEAPERVVPKAQPLNLDENVPLLMDVEELGDDVAVHDAIEETIIESSVEVEAERDINHVELTTQDIAGIEASVNDIGSLMSTEESVMEDNNDVEEAVATVEVNDGRQEAQDMMAQAAYAPVKKPGVNAEKLSSRSVPSLVLVTHVVPHDEEGFCGEDILYLVNSCDLRHGEKEIFHRFEQEHGEGRVQFSMANSFNPGTFNPENLLHERIHGISLFMSLPGPDKAMNAFEAMTEMASVIARNLGGDVHDETHSIMALQTIEHNRQQVRDFVRKQKLAGKK
jgi:cell division protein ZipA